MGVTQLPLIVGEVLLAFWLLSGVLPRCSRGAAFLCFAGFACVSLYNISTGEIACGCFGIVTMSPWTSLTVDLVALTALTLSGSKTRPLSSDVHRVSRFVIPAVFCVVVLATIWRFSGEYRGSTVQAEGMTRFGNQVLVVPSRWTGQFCPLLDEVDIGHRLRRGHWAMLLYHHDCLQCRDVMESLKTVALETRMPIAFVSVPPHKDDDDFATPPSAVVHRRLQAGMTWLVETPAIIVLNDGVVESVRTGI